MTLSALGWFKAANPLLSPVTLGRFNKASSMLLRHVLFLLFLGTPSMLIAQPTTTQVTVEQGKISGLNSADVYRFLGVPYAKPPVGELRWQPPQSLAPWSGVKSASEFQNQCMQKYIYDDMRFRAKGVSEDCLYLNIWTPTLSADKKLPVLVYFYGGGFRAGDGSEPRYDGAALAQQGIVVVTVNYRLGMFGLFAHPTLSKSSGYGGSGNYAFLDQQAALTWVNKNIKRFGGDPSQITIGGESAGSVSVSAHMVAAKSKGLFSAAIGQSGSILGPPLPAISLQQAHEKGRVTAIRLVEKLRLNPDEDVISQLRQVDAHKLLDILEELEISRFSATVDGLFIDKMPLTLYQNGQYASVPLLAGVNSQEGHFQNILADKMPNLENFKQAVQVLYPDQYQKLMSSFLLNTPKEIKDAAQALASDRFISFGAWAWMDFVTNGTSSNNETSPTYFYRYDHIRPPRKVSEGGTGQHNDRGAVHSAEIEYVFGNLQLNPLYTWTEEDHKTSDILQSYFVRFIKSHNPNEQGLAHWPQFSTGQWMILDGQPRAESFETQETRYQIQAEYYFSGREKEE